jgi:import inner membrane translocase subunit TIM22
MSAAADAAPRRGAKKAAPVLSLTMDAASGADVRDAAPTPSADDAAGFLTPCTLAGATAGLSGAALGWVFGFGGYWARARTGGAWAASLAGGAASAKQFGVMGGIYAAAACFAQRIRQKQDAWNGAISGCATGLALGWAGGPAAAAQSCATFGAFSYFLDGMGGGAARAAEVADLDSRPGSERGGGGAYGRGGLVRSVERRRAEEVAAAAAAFLAFAAVLAPCRDFGGGTGGRCLAARR